jgi:putative endopeptidase
MKMRVSSLLVLCLAIASAVSGQTKNAAQEPQLPYSPSLNLSSLDRTVEPCVDFYHFACGGWQKNNPIPPDQTSWGVYGKLYQDNLDFLHAILEQAAAPSSERNQVTREIGDYYAACMDEALVEKRGIEPLREQLDAIARLKSAQELAPVVAQLQLIYGRSLLFAAGSTQDLDNSELMIAELDQGGLGLPDRDYYTRDDDKSKQTRARYLEHVQKVFELLGDNAATAKQNAETVLRLETALAKASLTRVERRDPYRLKHKMGVSELASLAPNFDWKMYYKTAAYPEFQTLNVDTPDFFKELNARLKDEPLNNWETYLRFHVADSAAPYLTKAFATENFDFYRKYLRGAKKEQARWKRCVSYTNHNLDDALGQVYVAKVFSPELKQSTLEMVRNIEQSMEVRIQQLDWMSPETKQEALKKLHGIRNKIGYPDKWRDYGSVKITREDFAGNAQRLSAFERHRVINRIGKPVDHGEWQIPPTTVDAYYDPQMNDINFPAGVLQPPLYDPKMDAAPNYGDTGGTIGHELTHGFDDEGSQYDAQGNLRNWWTKDDREKFDARTKCVVDQYAGYVIVDDIKINSKLTLGEDVADLGGEILAYLAWQNATKDARLEPKDGFTPEQRFFIGFAQWACENERPEESRMRATVDPHSPAKYRINGVIVNMPEFAKAFACKAGQPMVKPEGRVCKVW